jgi:hypothetical protein
MARLSDLTKVTAEALDYPRPTVAMFSRVLRDADLLSKKGRGPSAAHATPVDGARLLTALLATPTPFAGGRMSQAIECVTDFGALVVEYPDTEVSSFTLGNAYDLPPRHTFEQAFAAIIAGFADERFGACIMGQKIRTVEVAIADFPLQGMIVLTNNLYRYRFEAVADWPSLRGAAAEKARADFESVSSKYKRGITSHRMIGFDALRKIAAVINGREVSFEQQITIGDLK